MRSLRETVFYTDNTEVRSWSKQMRKRDDFLVFGSPLIEKQEIDEVTRCLESGWIGTGPRVAQFEEAFRCYKKAPNSVAVSSCTAALHLSMIAAGIKPGDEVITTPMTFCATVNAIIHAGGVPVLADIDPVTFNIDPREVEKKITPRTKAILPVHFAGRPCDMDSLSDLAEQFGLKLIEDCAHAIEAEYRGKPVGTLGDFGCFSFYVTKNITTAEGGMVLTRNEDDAARIKVLALHGMTKDAWKRFSDEGYRHYYVTECGYKFNMTDLQAAIGIHQLRRIERYWQRRAEIWNRYMKELENLPIILPAPQSFDARHAFHLFTILIDEGQAGISRDQFLSEMTKRNIGIGVHYMSIPEHPYYQKTYGWRPEGYPHAMNVGRRTVSLPLSAKLSDKDVEDVIEAVQECLRV